MDEKAFADLIASVKWMKKHQTGKVQAARVTVVPDVRQVRTRAGIPQAEFARLIGVSVRTLQNWEQGHRRPTGAAAALLRAVKADPKAVIKALHAA